MGDVPQLLMSCGCPAGCHNSAEIPSYKDKLIFSDLDSRVTKRSW